MRILISLLFVLGLCVTAFGQEKLIAVKKIYVDQLGDVESSNIVRNKIINKLVKSGRFSVVEDKEDADAILAGVAGVKSKEVGDLSTNKATGDVSGSVQTISRGVGSVRLISRTTKEIIWTYDYKRGIAFKSAESKVADQLVDRLLKDAKEAEKGKK